jgi:hypothetical protein
LLSSGKNEFHHALRHGVLIGQIKLTRIHVALLSLPGVRVKQAASYLFTMSKDPDRAPSQAQPIQTLLFVQRRTVFALVQSNQNGGARRDRTDDILLAKQALSQLSYGPISETCHLLFSRNGGPG